MRLREVAAAIGARIRGDQEIEVTGVAPLDGAGPGDICLYLGGKFRKDLEKTGARALVTAPGTQLPGFTLLEVERPRLAFIGVIRLFHPEKARTGVQPGAVVSPGARLGRDVFVGATAVVGDGCVVGDGVEIHEGAVLYERVRVGDGSRLYARVVIREDCEVGRNVILHAGAVIGADGFGFEPDARGVFRKIPQVGRVVIEDDVEIGANTCIDRAALGETRIGRGVKIDNLCQLGHGVKVGEDTVISGMTGVSGSVSIGRHVVIGGGVGIGDHLTIGDGVMIAGRTGVTGNVPAGSIIAGFPHTDLRTWKKAMVMLYRMPGKAKADPGDGD